MKTLLPMLIILMLMSAGMFTHAQDNSDPLAPFIAQARAFDGTRNSDWQHVVIVFEDDPAFTEMVLVPVGAFIMGSDIGILNEMPPHEQTLTQPYWLDRTEVTRAQYTLCIDAGVCRPTFPTETSTEPAQPINNVSYYQARDYCAWRGMRLPTELEWEFAARGVESWTYPWGDEWNPSFAVWLEGATFGAAQQDAYKTAPVGSRPQGASWVGALDMAGNVWEWTSSLERRYPYTPQTHESDTSRLQRILRGGAFGSTLVNSLRAAKRFAYLPNAGYDGGGIRCLKDIE